MKGLSKGQKLLIGEVVKLLKLVIVMPATNAVSERSFSAMRRLYTYLRTNMSQNRLNNMMVLHVHKEKTDALKLVKVANEFVFGSEDQLKRFGYGNLWIWICKERTSQLNLVVFMFTFKNR